jgi:nucleotide-binding universal stress UspA family protein
MKILVPVDGSPASSRALAFAIDQVKPVAGARLIILNVQNFATLGLAEGAGIMSAAWIEHEEEKAASEALQEVVTACRGAGVTYATRSDVRLRI